MTAAHDTRADDVWMTAREVADYLHVSYVTIRRVLAVGALQSSQTMPRGRHLIRREWADHWAENRRTLPQPVVLDGRRTG